MSPACYLNSLRRAAEGGSSILYRGPGRRGKIPRVSLSVRCRCNVTRTIEPAKVGPWRLRCKQCGDVLYDPRAQAAEAIPVEEEEPGALDSVFQKRLMESAELKVMMSNDGENALPCQRHPSKPVVAACTRCSDLLCKSCLDRVGDEFVCSRCVAVAAGAIPKGEGGLMAWFRRLMGR
jgi:hypothetical protein